MDFASLIARYPSKECRVPGGLISYRESGSGEPLVLLHGISSGSASWLGQLTGLEGEVRVIAWDAPGYGASTPLTVQSPLAKDYADVLAAWVDALNLDSFTLAGHSLGALMAAAYASGHSERVKGLALLSPARGYGNAGAKEREERLGQRMDMLNRLGIDGIARQRAPALVSDGASDEAVEWIAWNMRNLNPSGYGQAARMLVHDDIERYSSAYRGPVIVRSARADQITPVDKCQDIGRCFGASYKSLPGLGHAFYLEAPLLANNLLRHLVMRRAENMGEGHD